MKKLIFIICLTSSSFSYSSSCKDVMGSSEIISILETSLRDEDVLVQLRAVKALARIGEPAFSIVHSTGTLILKKALEEERANAEIEVVEIAKEIGLPALSVLAKVLKKRFVTEKSDPSVENIRIMAIDALAEFGEPAIPTLEETLEDSNIKIRVLTVGALVRIGEPAFSIVQSKGIPTLEEVLEGENYSSYEYESLIMAIGVAEKIGVPALSVFVKALEHSSEDIRLQAVEALGRIHTPQTQ